MGHLEGISTLGRLAHPPSASLAGHLFFVKEGDCGVLPVDDQETFVFWQGKLTVASWLNLTKQLFEIHSCSAQVSLGVAGHLADSLKEPLAHMVGNSHGNLL